MPKFMLLYKGEATDVSDMSEEQAKAVMAKWGAWMGAVGEGLVDIGTPLGPSTSIVDDGSAGNPTPMSGYSIIEAADMNSAKAMTNGHPYLSQGSGDYAVDIYEMMPVPDMG